MTELKTPVSQALAPNSQSDPHFTLLFRPADARNWFMELSHDLALWRQHRKDWRDTAHACILHGRADSDLTPFPETVAARLGIAHIKASTAAWHDAADPYVLTIIAAMVRTFDDAASRVPCVLSFADLHSFPGAGMAVSPFRTCVTSALLSEIDDALKVPGLVLILTRDNCEAIALALQQPRSMDRLMAVPASRIARPANDNDPLAA